MRLGRDSDGLGFGLLAGLGRLLAGLNGLLGRRAIRLEPDLWGGLHLARIPVAVPVRAVGAAVPAEVVDDHAQQRGAEVLELRAQVIRRLPSAVAQARDDDHA